MKKQILVILIIMAPFLSCDKTKEENKNQLNVEKTFNEMYKFYDFNFKFQVYHQKVGLCEEILYDNGNRIRNNDYRLIHIKYYDKNLERINVPDTSYVNLTNNHLDSIYSKIVDKLTPKYKFNLSDKKVIKPIVSENEWKYGLIELDLLYRGDIYEARIDNFQNLYSFILGNGGNGSK